MSLSIWRMNRCCLCAKTPFVRILNKLHQIEFYIKIFYPCLLCIHIHTHKLYVNQINIITHWQNRFAYHKLTHRARIAIRHFQIRCAESEKRMGTNQMFNVSFDQAHNISPTYQRHWVWFNKMFGFIGVHSAHSNRSSLFSSVTARF